MYYMIHKITTLCITIFLLTLWIHFATVNAEDKIIEEIESTSNWNFESYISQNELGMLEVTLLTK
jgi:hypothetical protein